MSINKLISLFFYIVYNIGPRWLPSADSYFFRWTKWVRYVVVKRFVKKCGKNVNIQNRTRIGLTLIIGDNSGVGENSRIGSNTTIGNNVMMGPDVIICTQNHKYTRETFEGFIRKPVIIEDNVWIGYRVIILPGVTVGKNSIIGAGAVVTKDIPPYSVVGGVPARVLKSRE